MGFFLVWGVVYGLILGLSGLSVPSAVFRGVAAICELAMIGKNTYRSPLRNTIGWSIWGLGDDYREMQCQFWAAWDSYVAQASASGFSQEVFNMQINMLSNPLNMVFACVITLALAILGCLFGNRILRRHFKKAGIVG